jgi:hypothetical protein
MDNRKPQIRITVEKSGPGRRVVVELFPAPLFPGGEAHEGAYRVRVDRAWLRPNGQRYAFLTRSDVLAALWRIANPKDQELPEADAASSPADSPRPDLPQGSRIRIENGHIRPNGMRMHDKTFTRTDPFQGPDGAWRVFVVGRREPVVLSECERIEEGA